MRTTKYVGFLIIGFALIVMIGAAVLPVSPASQRSGPFRVDINGDNCGPAGVVMTREVNDECRQAARKRLLVTTAVGLLVVAFGMALFAGGDEPHHSRLDVPSRRLRRRQAPRSPGSRRYMPG